MTNDRLSDKERALLEAARLEVAHRRAAPASAVKGNARGSAQRSGTPSPAITPLDQPTVLGWDHPAANPKPAATARVRGAPAGRSADGAAATTPLDMPTVLGWDNPAAQQDQATAKWERISRLMAEEREAAEAQRRKAKRYGLVVSAALFAAGMMVVLALWPRPGA